MDYRWTRAAPGLYYLWNAPRGGQAIGKVDRMEGGRYRIKMLVGDRQPEKGTGRWTPHTAMAALEAHVRELHPGATFTAPRF